MAVRRVGLVGLGAIGRLIAADWNRSNTGDRLVGICVRPARAAEAAIFAGPDVDIVTHIDALLALEPDIVVEAAGHGPAKFLVEHVLSRGALLYLLSVGVLVDPDLRKRVETLTRNHGGCLIIPAGALSGFDGLASIARGTDPIVTYISVKPPNAWRGTPAEKAIDLDRVDRATVFFDGNAGDAARLFPKNANLAAAVALAGIGFERTRTKLIADPATLNNTGIIRASNSASTLDLSLSGLATPSNPKTSAIVADSVFATLRNTRSSIRFA